LEGKVADKVDMVVELEVLVDMVVGKVDMVVELVGIYFQQ
jgi:hypothetical protein